MTAKRVLHVTSTVALAACTSSHGEAPLVRVEEPQDADAGSDEPFVPLDPPLCGNDIIDFDVGEQCDHGPENGDEHACTSLCQEARCGDGLVWKEEEQCDPGQAGVACYPDCTIPPSRVAWTLGLEQAEGRWIMDLAVHPQGGVVAVGTHGGIETMDYWVQRYDADGKEIWAAPAVLEDTRDAEAFTAVAVDSQGAIIAAGASHPWDDGEPSVARLAKFSPAGEQLWLRTRFVRDSATAKAFGVAVDSESQKIGVVGTAVRADHSTVLWADLLYLSDGASDWLDPFTLEQGLGSSVAGAIAFGADGELLIAGRWYDSARDWPWLGTISHSGQLGQTVTDQDVGGSLFGSPLLAQSVDGDIVLVGDRRGESGIDLWLQKFDSAWQPLWPQPVVLEGAPDLRAVDVAVGHDGSIALLAEAGDLPDSGKIWVNRFSADGEPLWNAPYERGIEEAEYPYAIAVDRNGLVYVGGYVGTEIRQYAVLMALNP